MQELTYVSLFSGIEGIGYAAERAGFTVKLMCEIEPYPRLVLQKHWPGVPIVSDVRELTVDLIRGYGIGHIDLLAGGYPCQPFSYAGRRQGTDDPRHLWPYMLRVITETRPTWVLGENVKGHVTIGLDEVLDDLEAAGYETRTFVYPACAVQAPHERYRVFVVGHRREPVEDSAGLQRHTGTEVEGVLRAVLGDGREQHHLDGSGEAPLGNVADSSSQRLEGAARTCISGGSGGFAFNGIVAYSDEQGLQGHRGLCERTDQCTSRTRSASLESGGEPQSRLGRAGVNGFSPWLDDYRWGSGPNEAQKEWEPPRLAKGIPFRRERITALGNSVVPAQVEPILRAIAEYERFARGEVDGG